MNELELTFKEPSSPRGRHRHRRGGKPRKSSRRGRNVFALVVVLVVIGALAGGGWYGLNWVRSHFEVPDYTTGGTGEITIEVKQGDTGTDIAYTLYEADVVASTEAFINACNVNPQCSAIQPGFYQLRLQMRAADAVAMLADPANRVVEQVTIREGLSMFRTFELLSEALDIPVEEFEAAAEDPVALGVPDWWFNRDDDREAAGTVEGFLFPDTYEFGPDATAESVLRTMVNRFLTVADELDFVDQVQGGLDITPYEALIVASLVQAESGTESDMPKVARVAYNRLYRPSPELACPCLEFDVTTNYWLETIGEEPIHSGQMPESLMTDPDNHYNTKSQPGLPPGPINNPGKAALAGAMEPADGNWYYFVALTDGGESAFAETLAEHQANIQQACENGVPLC